MFNLRNSSAASTAAMTLAALDRSQAIIEFDLSGNVLSANQRFLDALGYTLSEIKGKHHSLFVPPVEAADPAYKRFWDGLQEGKYQSGQFKRISKGGREVWIEASYNPIFWARWQTDQSNEIRD